MKRKVESNENESKAEKKQKTDDNDELDNFDIKTFRKKLKGNSGFSEDLQIFLNNYSEMTADFLGLGGRPLEIVETMSKNEDKQETLSNLFQMLYQVCLAIRNNEQLNSDKTTVEGIKFLVTKNSNLLMKMLKSTKPLDKITALKLMAISVSNDRDIGIEILKNVELFSKTKSKEDLMEVLKVSKDQEQLRAAYVELIVSFLQVDSDTVLHKRVVYNRNLFELFVQDLHKDTPQIIEQVLSIMTEKILMSPDFNKVEKFKAFNDEVIKSLIKLYEWKGKADEKEHIQNISHYFLKLLLANKKYGIVFKSFTEKVKNLRQIEVIRIFKHVWMQEYPSKLVIEIVKACPDLIQIILDRLVNALIPKLTKEWFMCVNFTKCLLTALDPVTMINSFMLLPPKKVSTNIIKLSISHYILQNVSDNALIQRNSLECREISVSLLHLMLERCCQYIDLLPKLTNLKDFEQHRIKFDIINHIFTFFPHVDIILNSLYRSINLSVQSKAEGNDAIVKSQLKYTLEILLLLIERFPSIVEKIPTVIDYLEVLRPIYEYQLTAANIENNSDLEIEMKVVKIILLLQPNILAIDAKMFNRIFLIMIQVYSCSMNDSYRKEAKLLIVGMLQSTQIFPANNHLEILIWLEALRQMKPDFLAETTNKFIELIRSIKKSNVNISLDQDAKTITQSLLKAIDAADNSEEISSNQLSSVLATLLSMQSTKLNKISDFAEIAFILFYHSYPELKKSFKKLLSQNDNEVCVKLLAYVIDENLSCFEEILSTYDSIAYRKFQQTMISNEKLVVKEYHEDELKFLMLQTIFLSLKLLQQDELNENKIELLVDYASQLVRKLKESDDKLPAASKELSQEEVGTRKAVNKILAMNADSSIDTVAKQIFSSQSKLFEEFDVRNDSSQITKFTIKVIGVFKEIESFSRLPLANYRQKVLSQLEEVTENWDANILNIIEVIPFSDAEFIDFMDIVLKFPKSLKQLHCIMALLKQITRMETCALSSEQICEIENVFASAVKNPSFDFGAEFCDVLYDYFHHFTHNIAHTTTKFFEVALLDELNLNRSFIKVLTLLFTNNDINNEFFIKNASDLKKEILYPILHVAIKKELVDAKMMSSFYQTFKSGILRTIEKPNRAAQIYRENITSTTLLIEKGMPINECKDLSMKKFKFESTETYQLEILSAIAMKAYDKDSDKSGVIFINFINNWLQLFSIAERKMFELFSKVLSKWLDAAPKELKSEKFDDTNWEFFYTTCLKLGLKTIENSSMLVLLGKFIRILEIDAQQTTTIFDMIVTHSNFCQLVFNLKPAGNVWKRDLFYLMNILVQKNPLIAHKKHIPIYLSSYQATMSSCDQLILNLLRFYELYCEVDFFEFRPILFGSTALTHFSSLDKNELKISAKSIDEVKHSYFKVMNSFEKSIIENTMMNFPTKRKLQNYRVHELDQFLNVAPDEEAQVSQIYDPVFFLPLFEMLLGTGNFNFMALATKKNLLGLLPLGLSFDDENMRLMTTHILMKCRESIEGNKKKKELWIEFYEIIQKGLSDLQKKLPKGYKKGDKVPFPRAPSISSQLLGEFFNVLSDKLHCIHGVASNYVIVKDKFEFSTIPEFMVMFCSYELSQEDHRIFLLNTIKNGIRDERDFKLMNHTPLIKMFLACYGCQISTRKIDLLILKIIDNLVTKANAGAFLIERYGILLWIYQACVNVEAFEYDSIEMLLSLIDHLHDHFANNAPNAKLVMSSLIFLLEKFTKTKLSPKSFLKFLSTANKLQSLSPAISEKNFEVILDIVNVFIPSEMKRHLEYVNRYPAALDLSSTESILDETMKEMVNQCRHLIKNFNEKKKV